MTQAINFEANLAAIAAVLTAHSIHQVAGVYSGSSDSGNGVEVYAYDADGQKVSLPDVEVICERRDYRKVGEGYAHTVESTPMSLASAISDATEQSISLAGHDGYENNEGGEGKLTIYASGYAVLDHTDFCEGDEDHAEYDFDANGVFGPSLVALAEVMKKHGCIVVEAAYSGSGDSGDEFDITYIGPDDSTPVDEITDEVTYTTMTRTYNNGKFTHEPQPVTADFEQALEDVCFAMVGVSGHDGWENNEGGGGKLTVTAEGTAQLDHYDNGDDTPSDSSATWNDDKRQDDDEPVDTDD